MPTAFEERVYAATRLVPAGRVTTYKHLALEIGCHSSQAVGQALKRNPFAPETPCHRVIKTNLTIGGFAGQSAGPDIEQKRQLLKSEGIAFSAEGSLLDARRVFTFGQDL
jgi:methylated-DNA-[protein]-cysteine S-methyltransferase